MGSRRARERDRRDRRHRARGPTRALVRRPPRLRARRPGAEARAEARSARPGDPRAPRRLRSSPPRTRARTAPTSPSRRGSTAATTRASSRERRRELVEEELRGHLVWNDEGGYRYRYCQAAVVAAYGEMASEPPPFERVRVPTLLRPRRELVPPLRPPARAPTGRRSVICSRSSSFPADTRCCGTLSTRPLLQSARSSRATSSRRTRRRSRGPRREMARPSSTSSRVIVSGGTTMIDVPVRHQVEAALERGLREASDRRCRFAGRVVRHEHLARLAVLHAARGPRSSRGRAPRRSHGWRSASPRRPLAKVRPHLGRVLDDALLLERLDRRHRRRTRQRVARVRRARPGRTCRAPSRRCACGRSSRRAGT